MSNIKMAKLLVPSGGLLQDNAGETFSPTQFGLDLLLPANLVASLSPSLKAGDVRVNTDCALALWAAPRAPKATAAARAKLFLNMTLPFLLAFSVVGSTSSGARHGAGLRVTLQHFILQDTPDFTMKRVKFLFHSHLGNVARARQRHAPIADEACGGAGRHDDDAVGERDCFLEIMGDEQHRLAVGAP